MALTDFELGTNLVKLRDNRFAAMEVPVSAGCDAGDFIYPYLGSGIVGVSVNGAEEGEDTTLIYQAYRIIVPCSFSDDYDAGTAIAFEVGADQVTEVANGDLICGVLTKPVLSTDTECEIHLYGYLLPVCSVECAAS
jgi:hypothetical protein